MDVPVLVSHNPGCRWARIGAEAQIDERGHVTGVKNAGAGHSDAAKRLSETYSLHRVAGTRQGWIAVRYSDGSGGLTVYDTRAQAVADRWPWEDEYLYVLLQQSSMSVCAADSLLRYKRIMAEMEKPDRDARSGGPEVIPALASEDAEAQISAVLNGRGTLAMGYRR